MLANPQQKYQLSSIQTASPAKLLLMLYDGAIRFVKQAIVGIETKDWQMTNENLIKAQRIVNEFIASLNHDYEISKQLLEIYDYMVRSLIEANMKKNKEKAEEVLNHLTELREAWYEASKKIASTSGDHG
ncbi:MAG: flagellar export chaperone FliS [Candidatus Cohnella colombiensis]|uniref:Flagellar secretion chaperone FliS n=1 Tax=Candidatus Cohnella colombiensis TaxID=3121368 RepID=A0AA95EUW5_9BACL|nr:MAG: flagellar export chaperone FliS [Cohnella sp.]